MALSLIWRGSKGSSTGCEGVLWDPQEPLSQQPGQVLEVVAAVLQLPERRGLDGEQLLLDALEAVRRLVGHVLADRHRQPGLAWPGGGTVILTDNGSSGSSGSKITA